MTLASRFPRCRRLAEMALDEADGAGWTTAFASENPFALLSNEPFTSAGGGTTREASRLSDRR